MSAAPAHHNRYIAPALVALSLSLSALACERPNPANAPHAKSVEAPAQVTACTPGDPGTFERSLGGVPEVAPQWTYQNRCRVRLVDVREVEELAELGLAPSAEHVPMGQLQAKAQDWKADEPIVLICRSGRRSARALALLERQGFTRVASMTGGMLAWRSQQLPMHEEATPKPPQAAIKTSPTSPTPHDAKAPIEEVLPKAPSSMRWVKAASLLVQGAVSCVDGRSQRSVIGAPGGEAGELLLGLATLEQVTKAQLDMKKLSPLIDAYINAMGSLYLHTDRHALEVLGEALQHDERFTSWRSKLKTPEDIERFVRHPPHGAEAALLEQLLKPEHTGCGHLRLILQRPAEYGVRVELTQALLKELYRRMWASPEQLSFHILDGSHAEEAVVTVAQEPATLRPYDLIPELEPMHDQRQVFVYHPQAVGFVRAQEASFLLERSAWLLGAEADAGAYTQALNALASRQLQLTLEALAKGLPSFTLKFNAPDQPQVIPSALVLQRAQ